MKTIAVTFALALGATACVGSDGYRQSLTIDESSAPDSMVENCRIAQSRCTRCHDTGRITSSRFRSKSAWMGVVDRMRRRPQSGISPSETSPIVSCLVYRANGGKQ